MRQTQNVGHTQAREAPRRLGPCLGLAMFVAANGWAAPVPFTGTLDIDFSAAGGGSMSIPGGGIADVSGPSGALTKVVIPAGAFVGGGSILVGGTALGTLKGPISNGTMSFNAGAPCNGHAFLNLVATCPGGGLAGTGVLNGLLFQVPMAPWPCTAVTTASNVGVGSQRVTQVIFCPPPTPSFPGFPGGGGGIWGAGFTTGQASAFVSVASTFTEQSTGGQAPGTVQFVSPVAVIGGLGAPIGASVGMVKLALQLGSSGDVGITGKKLVIVDKLSAASKAKFVYVAKDTPADKGASNDATMISATFDTQITGLPSDTSGHFDMPQGANWLANKPTVAKYVNKAAPTGGGVKVSVIKPTKLLKMVGKSLGDSPVDIYQGGDPTESVDVAAQYTVVDGGATRRHCGEFIDCKRKIIGGGSGAKVVCKTAVPGASVTCP